MGEEPILKAIDRALHAERHKIFRTAIPGEKQFLILLKQESEFEFMEAIFQQSMDVAIRQGQVHRYRGATLAFTQDTDMPRVSIFTRAVERATHAPL